MAVSDLWLAVNFSPSLPRSPTTLSHRYANSSAANFSPRIFLLHIIYRPYRYIHLHPIYSSILPVTLSLGPKHSYVGYIAES
ncbi:hypothetical protein BT67DRAFT_119111 [Trichocladium antarcticum]|uniref:Uncharacterized protein n=1 Tax=Trichocladium antarcticum TaxID=1450529 RepID=A0AAN6UTQ9_9PEZI|nr:hypothetical protein BT67DRAFT_119111 [Trichocladium antarcticum]